MANSVWAFLLSRPWSCRDEGMRRVVLCLTSLLLLASVTNVHGRIGETEAELVERFGAVHARMPERMLEKGRIYLMGERVVLKLDEWRVTAVLIGGRCAKISYVKSGGWTRQQHDELLAVNAGRWTWSEIVGAAPKWQRTWRRSDGLVAKWMYVGGFAIEAQPFVDARARARESARRAALAALR